MSKIFENFTQAGADTTAKFGGTGLGLSITKTLVELMGGSLGVTSQLGEGAKFTITVPIDLRGEFAGRESDAKSIGLDQDESDMQQSADHQLLIIDDDILIHDLVKRKLMSESFKIHSALDGDSGIVKAREIRPDLILLDVLMPGKDGWSVIAELKADHELNSIPIIVISTLDDDLSAKALGANSYVQKPIEKSVLLEYIGNIFSEGLAGKKALVIDDDPDAREIVSRLLRDIGFEIEVAKNGLEGLDRLSKEHDLIILDLSMPIMDGFEFLTKIDESSLQQIPPIIVYSAMLLDETMKIHLAKRSAGIIDKNQLGSHQGLQTLIESVLNK
jgi:CheY-like chemotaxis protein